jgi:hypothetical protein
MAGVFLNVGIKQEIISGLGGVDARRVNIA